ncbi:hypothetical protein ABPG72_017754 [Tetrahymena utriculariae]
MDQLVQYSNQGDHQSLQDQFLFSYQDKTYTTSLQELGQLIVLKTEGNSGYIVQQKLMDNCGKKLSINQINLIYRQWSQFRGKKQDMRGGKSLFNDELTEKIKQRIRIQRTITAVDIIKSKTLNPNQASIRITDIIINLLYHNIEFHKQSLKIFGSFVIQQKNKWIYISSMC